MVTSYQYSAVTEYIEHVHAMINPCDIKKETNWFLYSSCTHVRNIMKLCVVEEMMERGDLRTTMSVTNKPLSRVMEASFGRLSVY